MNQRDALLGQLKAAEWMKQLSESPHFAPFRKILEDDLEKMKKSLLAGERPTPDQAYVFGATGLAAPKTPEDQVKVFMILRSVITYLEMRLREFDRTVEKYDQGVKQLKVGDDLGSQVTLRSG